MNRCFLIALLMNIVLVTTTLYSHQRIAVIGTGYVGLVTAAGLAHLGNEVTAVDIDEKKIDGLRNGIIPIYEPGLEPLVKDVYQAGTLTFTTDITRAIRDNDVLMIAVGTPMAADGSADMSYVISVIETIAETLEHDSKIICMKSTVPVGTGAWIRAFLENKGIAGELFSMVSNPEFLREGSAVIDFLEPDRIVIGTESDHATAIMQDVYSALLEQGIPLVTTSLATSEMIKYASNAFLAVKVSFINEIANLCDATGADVRDVAYAMGLDKRISPYFLRPGPGFGGSCFPKDSSELLATAAEHGVDLHVVAASLLANKIQKERAVQKLSSLLDGQLAGKTIAVWGLAFKANTDDIRYSPALVVINRLVQAGAHVRAYDPAAMEHTRKLIPHIFYARDMYEAAQGADALVVMTEWPIFAKADLAHVKDSMHTPILVDMRSLFDPAALQAQGIIGDVLGRP